MIKTINLFSSLCGVSSDEEDIANELKKQFEKSKYNFEIDAIGNVHVYKSGCKNKIKVLVFAHIDEIGFIIRKVEANGFVRFERIGGVNRQIIPGCKVVVKTKSGLREGVVGLKSHHFMPDNEKFIIPSLDQMYIDFFVDSKEELLDKGIDVGSLISFKPNFESIGEKYITGKALDNRVAVVVLLKVAQELENVNLDYDLHFAFPVMEEFNIRGLMPLIRKINPDYSIGLDITPACDTPNLNYNDIKLGCGPALAFMNFHGGGTLAGVLPDKKLNNLIIETARESNCSIQREISPGVITENAFALFENYGIKVANLSIPTRYTHTPVETMNIKDINDLHRLLLNLLQNKFNKFIEKEGGNYK